MPEDQHYQLLMSYDHRFATVGMHLHNGSADGPRFFMPLAKMIEQLGVSPAELTAITMQEYQWTEDMKSIDPARIRLLESVDWKGKTVLDIGGYDGFAAEIAHKGGAARAICLDNHQYEHYGWEEKKKEGVEYVQGDVMDYGVDYWPVEPHEKFLFENDELGKTGRNLPAPDTLINYNVLYHVKNPWAFLDKCREIIKEDGEMLICTLFRYHEGPWMYVYEPRECNPSDETVYFGPSLEALERLLKFTGWDATRYALAYDRVLYRCKPTAGWQRKHEDT